jgi:glycosyltransferase involved in cell wall biosynthesis
VAAIRSDADPAPRVLAVIPAHDEGPRIGRVVRAASGWVPVLVVDDGSSDDTAAAARASGAEVFEQRPNRGKGAALRAGFRRAIAEGFDAAVTLDGDGQHDPAEISRFLDAWAAGHPDLVVGRRDFSRMPVSRRIANTVGGRAFSWAVGQHVPDNQSGYRLVSRRLMEEMLPSVEQAFEFEVEMLARTIARGWPIAWVPISTIYAGEPSHIRPVAHFRSFVRVVRQARRIVRGSTGARRRG